MNSLTKSFLIVSALLLLTAFVPAKGLQAAIFEGAETEEGLQYGLCLDNPEADDCANVDCDLENFEDNPLCISETAAGTLFGAKDSLSGSGITHTDNFGDFVIKLVNFSLPYLTLAAFVGYVIAGFLYVTAMGNDDQIDKAKKILLWSSVGIIVVILSYAITNVLTGQLVQGLAG